LIVALFPFVEGFPAVLLLVLSPPLFSALLPVVFLLLPLPPPRAEEDEVDVLPPLSLGPAFVASVVFYSFFSQQGTDRGLDVGGVVAVGEKGLSNFSHAISKKILGKLSQRTNGACPCLLFSANHKVCSRHTKGHTL